MLDLMTRALFAVWLKTNMRRWSAEHYGWGGAAWTGERS